METNKLVLNKGDDTVYRELVNSLKTCQRFYFNVAFISFSGLQLLLEELAKTQEREVKGKVVTSTYLNFTDPYAVRRLTEFNNIDVKVFVAQKNLGFHPKGYIFEYEDYFKILIGSANLTQSALKSNIEWNISLIAKSEDPLLSDVMDEFDQIWAESSAATQELLDKYQDFLNSIKSKEKQEIQFFEDQQVIVPNSMQKQAIDSLTRLRNHGENKALVIAATGSGKTYMSAFDVARAKPRRVLFVVHREDILKSAMKSFKSITKLHDVKKFGFLSGSHKDFDSDLLFSTNISLANHLEYFGPEHFDYIIIDEAHHVSGDTYQRILNHFTPKFLLGMTATPERGDAQDIYQTFDNNIAVEIRLRDALDDNLVVPFHYFGITDAESVDFDGVHMNRIEDVASVLQTNSRVDHILKHLKFYGFEGPKRRCVGFCITIEHAKFMTREFQQRGIPSTYLVGTHSQEERKQAIKNLESSSHDLEVIFTVDIFNEGVDIPSINTVLMLRPTESPIVFIQQLGRGLRKHDSKSFVTVLDFIGNYSKSFLLAIALNGRKFYDKDSLKVAVQTDFANLPGCTHIQLDEIAKAQILAQIENENFNSLAYLKEEYEAFKLLIGNRIPTLVDFFAVDGAPDPLRYIRKKLTYQNFVAYAEGAGYQVPSLLEDEVAVQFLRFIEDHLPAKRVVDFCGFKLIMNQDTFTLKDLEHECLMYVQSVPQDALIHSMEYLAGTYFSSTDRNKYAELGDWNSSKKNFDVSESIKNVCARSEYRLILLDSINYGLDRYENEFGSHVIQIPDLSLYQEYNLKNVGLMCNHRKNYGALFGMGLKLFGTSYALMVDLKKDEDAIGYKDEFISDKVFQWESPNKMSSITDTGKKIINHIELGYQLHLFVRKFKEVDGVASPYVYIGQVDVENHVNEKPVRFQMKLHNQVPTDIFREFITIVSNEDVEEQ